MIAGDHLIHPAPQRSDGKTPGIVRGRFGDGRVALLNPHGARDGRLTLSGDDPEAAEARVREMCEKLLANTVIESYRIELDT